MTSTKNARPGRGAARAWVAATLMWLVAGPAAAAVIYQQTPLLDANGQANGYFSDNVSGQQIADDFVLAGPASVEGVGWWGGNAFDVAGDNRFRVSLLTDVSGSGTLLYSEEVTVSAVGTGIQTALGEVFFYQFLFAAAQNVGTDPHYLAVRNIDDSEWFWVQGNPAQGQSWLQFDGDVWMDNDPVNMAFQLLGTPLQVVPEPGAVGLMLLALGGLVAARRRRR